MGSEILRKAISKAYRKDTEVCLQIANIDMTKPNFPGIADFNLSTLVQTQQVLDSACADASYTLSSSMRLARAAATC